MENKNKNNQTLMLEFAQGCLSFQWPPKPTLASWISSVKAGFFVALPDAKMSQQTMKDVTKIFFVTCHLVWIRSEFHVILFSSIYRHFAPTLNNIVVAASPTAHDARLTASEYWRARWGVGGLCDCPPKNSFKLCPICSESVCPSSRKLNITYQNILLLKCHCQATPPSRGAIFHSRSAVVPWV